MAAESSRVVALADALSDLLYGIAGWLLVGLGTAGVLVTVARTVRPSSPTNPAASAVVVLLSLLFVGFGVSVIPRFRRQLNRRRSVNRFGGGRTVDERVLRADEGRTERCVKCGTRLREGLVRRYREEYLVAGIPVYTLSEGRNYYCPECAAAEISGTTRTETPDVTRDESGAVDRPATERD